MLILSPHLDDAALSCWHLLSGPGDVRVINVFDGSPPAGTSPPWWDTITGASDPRERMRERREEDRAALAAVGRSAVGLGLLDAQYRDRPPTTAMLLERLEEHVEPDALVYAPAAIQPHLDHALVRDAAVELARRGRSLRLYADLPHATRAGWPGWVTGVPERDGTADAWSEALTEAGFAVERLVARVRPLDAEARRRKLDLLAGYQTQRIALDALGFAPLEDARALAYEVTWEVPTSALPSRAGLQQAPGEPLVADAGRKALDQRA